MIGWSMNNEFKKMVKSGYGLIQSTVLSWNTPGGTEYLFICSLLNDTFSVTKTIQLQMKGC
jgi:hypothetical protein